MRDAAVGINVRAIDGLIPFIFNEQNNREEYSMQHELASQTADLEEALANVLREWNSQQAESQSPEIQRVPIERDGLYHPFDGDSLPM